MFRQIFNFKVFHTYFCNSILEILDCRFFPSIYLALQVLSRRQQLGLKQESAEEGVKGKGRKKGKGRGKGRGNGRGKGRGHGKEEVTPPEKSEPLPKRKTSADPKAKSSKRVKIDSTNPSPVEPSEQPEVPASKPKRARRAKATVDEVPDGKDGKMNQGEQPEEPEEPAPVSKPSTWARRRRPKSEAGALKWDTLRAVFTEVIRPHLSVFSAHEDFANTEVISLGSASTVVLIFHMNTCRLRKYSDTFPTKAFF